MKYTNGGKNKLRRCVGLGMSQTVNSPNGRGNALVSVGRVARRWTVVGLRRVQNGLLPITALLGAALIFYVAMYLGWFPQPRDLPMSESLVQTGVGSMAVGVAVCLLAMGAVQFILMVLERGMESPDEDELSEDEIAFRNASKNARGRAKTRSFWLFGALLVGTFLVVMVGRGFGSLGLPSIESTVIAYGGVLLWGVYLLVQIVILGIGAVRTARYTIAAEQVREGYR